MPDTDLDFLRSLDPTLHDEPPAPGSARYEAIRPSLSTAPAPWRPVDSGPWEPARRPALLRRQRFRSGGSRRWMTWAAAGTGVAASVVATMVVLGGNTTSASAAVLTAADKTETVVTLRGTTQDDVKTGGSTRSTIEANGPDMKIITQDDMGTITTTIVGNIGYESNSDGDKSKQEMQPEQRLAPFADSAADVVRAALNDADVTDKGTDEVRGAEATHYHVQLTAKSRAALAALPPVETAWFEVEHAEDILSLDVWTSGNLIRRIAVDQTDRRTLTEFYDFGQPVTITAPTGF
ncbi:hypothetical protein GCM10010435_94620 [Winogradskya consettensis]|uniref:LppX_LprAFG lipoprotein n=1 Tax=Winogradskya consettensis TaxID=113560 RepID=A0A919SZF6_9ACTN|nr:hypothetical protein [Actinoplanes consettensis]GIM79848.1 hypothetical protein Aco04nite_67600 [Actinoplanes consettensis]